MNLPDLIEQALKEDLPKGDVTTDNLDLGDRAGKARLLAKEDLVLSGREVFAQVMRAVDSRIELKWQFGDGDFILARQTVCVLQGSLSSLLKAERTALNFLGHLSGVATLTRCFVKQIEHTPCRLLDTRKTLPLLRTLEKAAVKHGLGHNHRLNLSDAVLIKDNHIQAVGSVAEAVRRIRRGWQGSIEVECGNLEQVREAVGLKVTRILLDNMDNQLLSEALALIPKSIETEASGNMRLERVRSVAELGVTYISVGAITHSAPTADLSLDFEL